MRLNAFLSILIFIGLTACEPLKFKNTSSGGGGGGGSHGGLFGRGGEGNGGGGGFGFGSLGGGGPTAQRVTSALNRMKRQHLCGGKEKRTLKCARMVARVLRAAGVNVADTASTDDLYANLKRIGWTNGKCQPGSVRHDEGTGGFDHMGIVGKDGGTWHNHGSKGKTQGNGETCGYLDNSYYDRWMRQGTKCLNPPK